MRAIVFDTETTGKYDFRADYDAAHQPRLVQLAAQLIDTDSWNVHAQISLLIAPGIPIPAEASAVHGITDELVTSFGVSEKEALLAFLALGKLPHVFVAHNMMFDRHVITSALMRVGAHTSAQSFLQIDRDHAVCTMSLMTPICRLPGRGGEYKWPKLEEAYRHAFSEAPPNAHDALGDVIACARVYRWYLQTCANAGGAK